MSVKASAEITLVRVDDGADGESIDVVSTQYKAGSSPTSAPSGTWSNSVVAAPEGQYLWTRTLFSDGKLLYSVAKQGEKGEPGEPGNDGDSGIIVSPTAPGSPKVGQLWQTATGEPIKRWTGTAWTIHYISAKNLQAEVLSAITANLGTITAGIIKSISGDTVINVNDGTIVTHSGISNPSEEITRIEIGKGRFSASRKDANTNMYNTIYGGESIDFLIDGQKKKGLHWSYDTSDGGYVDLVSGWSTLDSNWNPADDFPIIRNLKKIKAALSDTGWIDVNNVIKYRIKNGMCTVRGYSYGNVNIGNNATIVGTLPAPARPSIKITGAGTSMANAGYETEYSIETNGSVSGTYLKAGSTSPYWGFTVTYPAG